MTRFATILVILLLGPAVSAFGQTGKVTGTVTEAETGEPLPGVNVVIEGTQQGSSTGANGQYTILNVPPGTYTLRATFVGYVPKVIEDVRVNIDLTTTVNIELQAEAVGLDEVLVQAQQEIVRPDISANMANLSAEDVENIPVTDIQGIITQQPGVQGLTVRGGQLNETLLNVDGYTMRDGINNEPISNISYTAIEELQVQTGGFNAEYGNVRSGLINIVTKDAPRDRYTVDIITKYRSPSQKSFGISPGDRNSFYLRPFLDPDVAFEGTETGWDEYTQAQYPTFEGWNAVSERFNSDGNPNNDLSPEQLQELFKWYRRKDVEISAPDYTLDGSVGGPVPGISEALGNLRFFGTFRQTQNAYLVPQSVDGYTERTGRLTLSSDITDDIQLDLRGMYSVDQGLDASNRGYPVMARNNAVMVDNFNTDLDRGSTIFANDAFSVFERERNMLGATLTHSISSKTFYEVRLQRINSQYDSSPSRVRDTSSVATTIGGLSLDEAPFGYWPFQRTSKDGTGMLLGGSWAESRDTSLATTWSARFDITHQLTQDVQLKAGGTYLQTAHDRNNGFRSTSGGDSGFSWSRNPRQGAGYVQSKLEFEGLIANVGLRLDYFNAGGEWYQYEPYDERLAGLSIEPTSEALDKRSVESQFALSPRLGVSFPVTDNSKVFFNYGHFRQMLQPTNIYLFNTPFRNRNGPLRVIGNPEHPMPKTVSYELGYEQNFFDQFLFRLTGYYKDISEQSQRVRFISADGNVNYRKEYPYQYRDIRGFEVLLRKNRGWYQGFINYTFDARKSGRFGVDQHFENPVEQREYERTYRNQTFSSIPQPYVRANLRFIAPRDFGPEVVGTRPLADWRLSALVAWFSGNVFTWDGPGSTDIPEVQNNVRWQDNWDFDLRLAKNFNTTAGDVQFFVDVSNVLNLREMRQGKLFSDAKRDFDRYMTSLHLPEDAFEDSPKGAPYDYIPGDDRPGDYRKPGTSFVPIEIVGNVSEVQDPASRPLYYEESEGGGGTYMRWRDGQWSPADDAFVNKVLENKQYIDMPNMTHFTFLNPRDFTFGLRLTF